MNAGLFARPAGLRDVATDQQILDAAYKIMEERLTYGGAVLGSPEMVRMYLRTRFSGLEHEEFHVLFIDARSSLIAAETLFRGTLTQTSVYPREVVKAALKHNAAAVILAHNHPSGNPEPSQADRFLTDALKAALALIDVQVLDHMVVAGHDVMSFAERGWL